MKRENCDLKKNETLDSLIEKYGTNRGYTAHFLNHMLANHKNNPQFDLYMESELGSLKRSRAFAKSLCKEFYNDNLFFGKDCLDIGSSAGNTLIMFIESGADKAVGIEIDEGRYQTALININECTKNTNGKIQMFLFCFKS